MITEIRLTNAIRSLGSSYHQTRIIHIHLPVVPKTVGNGFDSLRTGFQVERGRKRKSACAVSWAWPEGEKKQGELVALLPTAPPTCYYPVTHMSITCQYGNNTCQIMMFFYACIGFNNTCAELGIFRRMRKCSQSALTLDSRIIDVRHQNKVYNQPPPSPPSFFPSQTTLGLPIFYLAPLHLWACSQARFLRTNTRELKQKRRRRLGKRLFKSKVALLQKRYRAYSNSFNSSNVGNFFLDLNSKKLYQSSGKENESRCLVFTSSTKREIRHFYVVVVQRLQRNVQKSVMHVQSCCFAKLLKPIAFLTFSLTSPSSLRKLAIATEDLSLRTKNCQCS